MELTFIVVCYFIFCFKPDDLQIITPAKMHNNFRGFGISFSTNPHVDVDSNGLEDLAIGISFFCLQFNNERVQLLE